MEVCEVNPMTKPLPDFLKKRKKLHVLKRSNSSDFDKSKWHKSKTPTVEKRNPRRNIPVKNYYEEEEPKNDRYIYCDKCEEDYLDYCTKCRMLISLKTNPVPMGTKDRAIKTIPLGTLDIKPSKIHGLGVFAIKNIRSGVRMGPYEGKITRVDATQGYAWKLRDGRLIDASDETNSNYLRYVNCARNVSEQNIVAYQYKGKLYYRTVKDILQGEELLVYYGTSFAKNLGIDPRKYFEPTEEETEPDFFSCKYCGIGLSTKENRNTHEKYCKFHPIRTKKCDVTDTYTCKYCEECITTKKFWIRHERLCPKNTEINQKKIENGAELNPKTYTTKWKHNLLGHIQMVHEKENAEMYSCNKISLKKHISRHEGYFTFTCTSCNKGFKSKKHFDGHLLKYHSDQSSCVTSKIHACNFCFYKTKHSVDLARHVLTHTSNIKKKFLCAKCEYSSNDKSNLKQHLLTHVPAQLKPYVCIECRKQFSRKGNLDSHIISNHPKNGLLCKSVTNKIYNCELCNYKCINCTKFKYHMSTHTGNKPYKCTDCNKKFSKKHYLDSHIISNHPKNGLLCKSVTNKIYNCELCNYKCIDCTKFKYHMSIHTGNKPYKCTDCNEKFISKFRLESHILTKHKNNDKLLNSITSKIYNCELCNYNCILLTSFKNHMSIHTGNKPYKCTDCNKKFSKKHSLDSHIISNHPKNGLLCKSVTNKIYNCELCNKKFISKIALESHILTKHKNNDKLVNSITSKIHSCNFCSYQNVKSFKVKRHMKTHKKKL